MWLYENKEFKPTHEELSQWVGFVYEITDTANGMKYIGKKTFWSKRRLAPLKGKTRKRVVVKESDWMEYYGSNEAIKQILTEDVAERFSRSIVRLCTSKGEMSYMEAKEQFDKNVLFDPNYYNEFIGLKCHSKHVAHLAPEMINGRR